MGGHSQRCRRVMALSQVADHRLGLGNGQQQGGVAGDARFPPGHATPYRPLKSGARFSRKAAMPSFWSSLAKSR